jgi:hypothetical protein
VTAAIGLTAVAVVGSEPISTGAAALDLARAEARHRRVMIVDLIGDAPPLRAVVATDDPHGVSDAFAYGVSFGVITRHTTVHPNVSIIPSGTEPIPFATALPSARWTQLIDHVRARGELIVFAILSSTPAMGSLTDRVDCVIAAPSRLHEVLEAVLAAATTPADAMAENVAPPAAGPKPARRPVLPVATRSRFDFSNRSLIGGVTAIAAIVIVAFGWGVMHRQGTDERARRANIAAGRNPDRADTETSSAQLAAGAADSTAAAQGSPEVSAAAAAAAADSAPGMAPFDSANGATYAVRVATYPTFVEALRALRRLKPARPAATITPIVRPNEPAGIKGGGTPVFALMVGASHTMAPLDTVVAHWPFQSGFAPSIVVHAPFGLLLAGGLPTDSARRLAASLVKRGVPAYVLVTPAGGGKVYAGAFDSADQAAPLATSLRNIGFAPIVAYRTGHAP